MKSISIHALTGTQVSVAFSRFQQQQLHISGGRNKLRVSTVLGGFSVLQKRPSHRASLIAGIVAATLFVGALASNLIASYLETTLKPYRVWVLSFLAIALIVTVATAIVEARRRTHSSASNEPGSTEHSAINETTRIRQIPTPP
ncbi:MAG TPA: hypothetical protein VKA78_07860, partial [Pyrinomonadaceae bacterium]|nr:hypothetical protein [Pyrinomonadaceae bacterium]